MFFHYFVCFFRFEMLFLYDFFVILQRKNMINEIQISSYNEL